jgi:hypothetical protein
VRGRSTLVAAAALAAALLTSVSAGASAQPSLLSATASRGHVVAVFTLGSGASADIAPDHIAVALRPALEADGSFVPANVRLQESVSNLTHVSNGERVRTQHRLRPGRYYVKVSAVVVGLDCTPHTPCRELWSNARRIVVPRP